MQDAIYINQTGTKLKQIGDSFGDFCSNIKESVVDFWNEHEISEKLKKLWVSFANFGKKTLKNVEEGFLIIGNALKDVVIISGKGIATFLNWCREGGIALGEAMVDGLKKFGDYSKKQFDNLRKTSKEFFSNLKVALTKKMAEAKVFYKELKIKTKENIKEFCDNTKEFLKKLGNSFKSFLVKTGRELQAFGKKSNKFFKELMTKAKIKGKEFKQNFGKFFNTAKGKLFTGLSVIGAGIASFYKNAKENVIEKTSSFKEAMQERREARIEEKEERRAISKMVDEELELFVENSKEKEYAVVNNVIDVDKTQKALGKILKNIDLELEVNTLQDIIENEQIASKFKAEVETLKNSADSLVSFVTDTNNPAQDRLALQELFEESEIVVGYNFEDVDVLESIEEAMEDLAFEETEEKEDNVLFEQIIASEEETDSIIVESESSMPELNKEDEFNTNIDMIKYIADKCFVISEEDKEKMEEYLNEKEDENEAEKEE